MDKTMRHLLVTLTHKLTGYPHDMIEDCIEKDKDKGLIESIIGQLNFHVKIMTGWAPPEYQTGHWNDKQKNKTNLTS